MEGAILGRPTLLAIYNARHSVDDIMARLNSLGYPLEDVAVYYRVEGTDQVIDATTGHVAAGQSMVEADLKGKQAEKLETLVLMHPPESQAPAVQEALLAVGPADIKYVGETRGGSRQAPLANSGLQAPENLSSDRV